MYLGENNGNLSETKKIVFFRARFPTLSQKENISALYEKKFSHNE